jgi:hypothetical protein
MPNLQALNVEIKDLYGMVALFKQNIRTGETINLSALPAGTYFVKMYGANQKHLGTMKILKVN